MFSVRFHTAICLTDPLTASTNTLSLHDALPIWARERDAVLHRVAEDARQDIGQLGREVCERNLAANDERGPRIKLADILPRSEEHTAELQSRLHIVCRLLLEKKRAQDKKRSVVR